MLRRSILVTINRSSMYHIMLADREINSCKVRSSVLRPKICTKDMMPHVAIYNIIMSRQSTDLRKGIAITLFFFINPPTDQRVAPINGTFTTDSTFSAQLNSVFTPDRVTSP